jgi:hypothetical protein
MGGRWRGGEVEGGAGGEQGGGQRLAQGELDVTAMAIGGRWRESKNPI